LTNGSLASPRMSVSREPEVMALSPLIPAIDDMAQRGYLRMWPRPPVPGIADCTAIAGEEIHDILTGTKTLREGLARAQHRAETQAQLRFAP
jgi:multiple sugar transport system substrate-binding protein